MPPIHDGEITLYTRQIAYFHVPMAVAMEVAFLMAAWHGLMWLRTRQVRHDSLSLAYAEIGTIGGIIATATGSIFAKTNWNAYWSWDPQQVGVVITLLTYFALFSLRGAVDDEEKRRSLWAVYAIIGWLTALFASVIYHRILPQMETLHPQNTLFTSDPLPKIALWFNVIGYVMVIVWITNIRARLETAAMRVQEASWA